MSRFTRWLLQWYEKHQRTLPWRGHPDPYAVWVSEIMLQQTRVEAVVPYFRRWMKRFPTIKKLATASERDVLKQWEGMGYYARARNLRRAAQIVSQQHNGILPRDPEMLRSLPGIGRYTAGAIASIAFGLDEPALDGNIRRMLARVFNVSEAANSPEGMARLWELAKLNLPAGRASEYNQAMMDLGSTVCVPRRPRCEVCPVKQACEAYRLGIQAERPVLKSKKPPAHRVFAAAVIVRRGQVLMALRPSRGLLGGMWEFPKAPVEGSPSLGLAKAIRATYDTEVKRGDPIGIVKHAYSHFSVEVHAFRCEVIAAKRNAALCWVRLRALEELPMGRVDRQIARKLV